MTGEGSGERPSASPPVIPAGAIARSRDCAEPGSCGKRQIRDWPSLTLGFGMTGGEWEGVARQAAFC